MNTYLKLFVTVFFILVAVKTVKSDFFSISGTVRYADNNEIVTVGMVKVYDVNSHDLEGVAIIQPNGDYILPFVRGWEPKDVIGFPNADPEVDWVATGYPDQTNPELYTRVTLAGDLTGIDIYVQRIESGAGGSVFFSNVSGLVLDMNEKPLADAMIYAMIGDKYYGYGLSDAKGNYSIKNIPAADYILVAHKLGHQSVSTKISLNENGLTGLNIVMNNKNNTTKLSTPVQFRLSQNFPNPFNPATRINYIIPVNGFVSIKVYNSLGQLAAILVNEVKEAGSYEVGFDASSLSSGVYFYRLDAGNYTETKKMSLIR